MKKIVLASLLAGFLLGCGSNTQDQALGFEDKDLTIIKIVALGDELEYKAQERPNINFSKGKFNGFAGCNRFFGEFSLDKNKLSIAENSGSTKMLCDPEAMIFEDALLASFKGDFELKKNENGFVLESPALQIHLQ
ncbi:MULTISPECIES: META domain-containing protein [unclassified Campylobacter]|uniref:META domain-containing protein n=1 Tax=unclassified Campylobacter TaxID=2593542 RepID=UPI001389B1BF|nr:MULTISPECIES: META domain-containing protein [unclassified Campylobacter]NDJ26395.1 META domain-containing protein [Campylobacter sp. MIT 19-121]